MHTKEKILEAALRLFSEKGFRAASIREITKSTGITPGSLYNHFSGKDELLQAVYDYYTEQFIPQTETQDYEALLRQLGVIGLFEHLTKSYIHAMRNDKLAQLTKIILMEQYTNPVAGEIAFRDRQRLLSAMEVLCIRMHALGYIKAGDPESLGRLLGYLYLGFTADNFYYFYLNKQDPDTIAARQTEAVLKLIREIVILR